MAFNILIFFFFFIFTILYRNHSEITIHQYSTKNRESRNHTLGTDGGSNIRGTKGSEQTINYSNT